MKIINLLIGGLLDGNLLKANDKPSYMSMVLKKSSVKYKQNHKNKTANWISTKLHPEPASTEIAKNYQELY